MLLETLYEKQPQWTASAGPEGAVVVCCQVSLARNVPEFPFPGRCSDEERASVEERFLGVLDNLGMLANGRYYSLEELDDIERRFLAERQHISFDMLLRPKSRAVYIAEDQGLSIMVNGADHLCTRVILPGQQVQEAWTRLNLLDDTLNGALDFAFSERLGYLSSDLTFLGTGLKAAVILHLPGLVTSRRLPEWFERVKQQQLTLSGIRAGLSGDEQVAGRRPARLARKQPLRAAVKTSPEMPAHSVAEATAGQSILADASGTLRRAPDRTMGDLYVLMNQSTLGVSEEEIIFHLRHAAAEIIREECAARETLLKESVRSFEDRVFRARGIAQGARLLEFAEGVELLASMRLGRSMGYLDGYRLEMFNRLLLDSQAGHIEMAKGQPCSGLALNMVRADLFNNQFS